MSEVNLWKALSFERIGEFLDSLAIAGATAADIERIADDPVAARAVVLSSRIAVAPATNKPEMVPYSKDQLRVMLASANIPQPFLDEYANPERFMQLISKRGAKVTRVGLECIALDSGAGMARLSHQQIADRRGVTRERARQIVSSTYRNIRLLILSDRPPVIEQVTTGPLSDSMSELLGLLG